MGTSRKNATAGMRSDARIPTVTTTDKPAAENRIPRTTFSPLRFDVGASEKFAIYFLTVDQLLRELQPFVPH